MRLRATLLTALPAVLAAAGALILAAPAGASTPTPVLESTVIGYSVSHRPIVAYHLGNPTGRASLIIGQMHGDEPAGITVVRSLVTGSSSVEGLNLWVIPTMNPDGAAAHTRQNAHHVDLNRNWPYLWAPLSGMYYSGPHALSEPETQAVHAFLLRLHPYYLVVLHQPLFGADYDGANRGIATRISHNLGIPTKALNCWSTCHGSMTDWYQHAGLGVGETVEFGSSPSTPYLTGTARRGIVAAMGGSFGDLSRHDPRAHVVAAAQAGAVTFSGWSYDRDTPGGHVLFTLYRDGHVQAHSWAALPSPALDAEHHLAHGHAFSLRLPEPAGTHTFCLLFANFRAGTGNTMRCVGASVPRG